MPRDDSTAGSAHAASVQLELLAKEIAQAMGDHPATRSCLAGIAAQLAPLVADPASGGGDGWSKVVEALDRLEDVLEGLSTTAG